MLPRIPKAVNRHKKCLCGNLCICRLQLGGTSGHISRLHNAVSVTYCQGWMEVILLLLILQVRIIILQVGAEENILTCDEDEASLLVSDHMEVFA